jgi:hypothetical protein
MAVVLIAAAGLVAVNGVDRSFRTALHAAAYAESDDSARFIALHEHYLNWRDGLFGSRGYHRRVLYDHLVGLLGKSVKTGYDYYLESPVKADDTRLRFVLFHGSWLFLDGKVSKESIREVVGDDPSILLSWWRSRKLLSVSGKIKRFRIDDWERKIFISLDDVRVAARGGDEMRPEREEKKGK